MRTSTTPHNGINTGSQNALSADIGTRHSHTYHIAYKHGHEYLCDFIDRVMAS